MPEISLFPILPCLESRLGNWGKLFFFSLVAFPTMIFSEEMEEEEEEEDELLSHSLPAHLLGAQLG